MAAAHSITSRLFPDGTTLGLYDAEGYSTFPPNGPAGSALYEVEVSGHSARFTGLTANHPYFAAAKVSGEWRYVKFIPAAENPPGWYGSGVTKAELATEEDLRAAVSTKLDNLAIINVQDYGAKGDGETDDDEAIQKAINAAEEAGGGIVYLPPGTYIIGATLEVGDFTTLRGAGSRLSTLKLKAGAKTSLLKSKRYEEGGETGGTEHVSLFDLGFDANLAENEGSTADLVALDGIRPVCRRLYFKDGYRNFSSKMSRNWSEGTNKIEDGLFSDLEMTGSQAYGFYLEGPHDSEVSHVIMRANEGVGMFVHGTAMVVSHVHVYGASTYAFHCSGGHSFDSCIAEGSTVAHVGIFGDSTKWIGGWLFSAGGADAKVGFLLGDESHTANGTLIKGAKLDGHENGAFVFDRLASNSSIEAVVYATAGEAVKGEPADSVSLDLHVSGGIEYVGPIKTAGCSVILTESQEIASGSLVAVNWTSDEGARCYNTSDTWGGPENPERFVAPVDGLYQISASVAWDPGYEDWIEPILCIVVGSNAWDQIARTKAGASGGEGGDQLGQHVSTIVRLSAGEYLRVMVRHSGGVGHVIFADAHGSNDRVSRASFELLEVI